MLYIEACMSYLGDGRSLFLAGGITGCPDWQLKMVGMLYDTSLVVLSPHRAHFPIEDKNAAQEQIEWEYTHLRKATAISFWFPCETLCPIVLYELGAWSMTDKKIFVGVHPDYQRRQDVLIQTSLVRPDVQVVSTLAKLAKEITAWSRKGQ